MDSPKKKFEIKPFPLESEFRVMSIRRRLPDLSRAELEDFLTESLSITMRLAHQVQQFQAYVDSLEGKSE